MVTEDKVLYKVALWGSIFIYTILLVFHLLVIGGIIPHNIVWGGRIHDRYQLHTLETFSLFTNALFLFIVLLKARIVKIDVPRFVVQIGLWVMSAMFVLNTVGNFYSQNTLEKAIFTPVTLLSAVFSVVLAVTKNSEME